MQRKERKRTRRAMLMSSGAIALGASMAATPSADAATFNVTNLADSGAGSLRDAIAQANAAAGADVITFQSGLTGTITLTTGQLYVSDSVDIQGPGPTQITVSGNDETRIFYLYNSSALLDITISGLTLTDGFAAYSGGAIMNWGEDLTLDDVVITGNHADDVGGGVLVTFYYLDSFGPGSLTVTDSTISYNEATNLGLYGAGGGIGIFGATTVNISDTTITENDAAVGSGGMFAFYVSGAVTLDNVVISNNDAGSGAGGGAFFGYLYSGLTIQSSTISGNEADGPAGGLAVTFSDGTVRIAESTISGNESQLYGPGGGIVFDSSLADLVVENSTISGNSTTGNGGGIYIYSAASAEVRHTTISGNSATGAGGGIYAYGSVTVDLSNSIVADSTTGDDLCGAGTFNVSFSLVEDPGIANINDLTPADNIFGVDPQLGPLQNNGGTTETHKPAPTSPVIDAGDPAFAPPPATDQRGFPREVPDGGLDMGSVELNPGTVQFSTATANVAENGGSIMITVTRTGGSEGPASVPVSVSGGTATGGVDYTFAGATPSWVDGETGPKTFTITINDDLVFEGNETIDLQLGAPTGASLGSPSMEIVTIVDNEVQPTISINDPSVAEGDAGTTTLTFNVSLSGPSATPVSVNFTTNPITATEGTDYDDATGVVTFPALSTSQPINVTVNGDMVFEGDETLSVVLSTPSGATIADDTGTGTIVDNEVQPTISIDNPSVAEGDAGTTTLTFTVSLSGQSATPVTVNFTTNPISATEGTDYQDATGVVTFPALSTSQPINVAVNGDTVFEGNETLNVVLSTPSGATIADDTGIGTIVDNEAQPTISINDPSVLEGDAGTTTLTFTVSLSGQSATPVTVNFTTNPVSATEGTDYLDATGTVNFPALSTSQPINVTVNGDPDVESDETFNVVLSAPSGATIADDTGTGTILNDDAPLTADLGIVKTVSGFGPHPIGSNITFNITVTNSGPAAAAGVTVTDVMPSNTTLVSATPSQGSCSGTTTVICNLGGINDDANATISIVATITGAGPGSNTATVTASTADVAPGNNQSIVAFQVATGEGVPTLNETMQLALAALIAAFALGILGKRS